MKQKARLAQEQADRSSVYRGKNSHRRRISGRGKKAITVVAVIAAVCLVFLYVEKRSYHSYKVLNTSEQEDVVSTQYVEMDGDILRYSPDGVSVVDSSMNTVWNETYTMQNPIADVNGSRAVIADSEGTSLYICDKKGVTGTVTTSYSIVKVRVAANGMVAAILDNDENTWINFYNSDGSLVAENLTKIDDPGYPMDVAVSDNGVMMVTFQYVDGSKTTSYVAFYNYGDVGQNEDDRIVSGYTYENVVIPQVECISESQYIALRDDGFSTYQGNQIPKEVKTINVKQEIVSTFFDDQRIGLVFKNNSKDSEYTMEVYSMNGQLKFRKNFNVAYSTIKMSDGNIIMYNSSQICVMNSRGVQKYMGSVDGTIRDFFKIGWNKYLMVMDNGVSTIKFS
ncbi:hypothetical protein HFM85_08780 [Blautia schinkii]|nr:hypothetical protein [Blautia schinkii]NSK23083.1 hypothetical protein [Blautia schinkii]NSK26123.1 hypothetical protein [Blautia schinkii]NSK32133.1 hypothetical protein [Blautia schinkii]NSK50944.1 hypothetical protein [Blautia schinkii]